MILTSFAVLTTLAKLQATATPLSCPINLEPVTKGTPVTDYNGVRFTYCCGGCDAEFIKAPQAALEKAAKAGKTVGVFLFDPVSQKPIDSEKAAGGSSDYKGVRFFFSSTEDKTTFDKSPAKFGVLPKKEALFCPINKAPVASYDKASGYGDYEGTRYYFCCAGCDTPFAKDPAKFAPDAKDYVKAPKAIKPTTKDGAPR